MRREASGIGKLVEMLDAGSNVIVMCGCKDLATFQRDAVAERMATIGTFRDEII
jgi:hypothetical protein